MPSHLEQQFAELWVEVYPAIDLYSEYRFCPPRKYRFDFAHLQARVAIEIDGGHWTGGRHNTGSGFQKDCEKFNLAASRGWLVFRLTGEMITAKWLGIIAQTIAARLHTQSKTAA